MASQITPRPMPAKLKKQPKKTRKRLNPVSAKQAKRLKEYAKLRKTFLLEHPICQFEEIKRDLDGTIYPEPCTFSSSEVHHRAGRGKNLLKTETWIAVCLAHHREIHSNPEQSYAQGTLLPRWKEY